MGKVDLPYYVVKKGFGYWQPTKAMKALGAKSIPCGKDGPKAWTAAKAAMENWRERLGVVKDDGPMHGTLADALVRFKTTPEWPKKAPRTREEWDRCWVRLGPTFGDVDPNTITLEQISAFRAMVAKTVSEREAHRCIKIWRALWRVAAGLKYVDLNADPALGVRNTEPEKRQQIWSFLEVIKLVKTAWRHGYYGLAAIMAVAWDSQFSPVDVRTLRLRQRVKDAVGTVFNIGRAKTGRAAAGTLSRRSEFVLDAYLRQLGVDLTPDAPIFRNRSGRAYSSDTMGDDFRDVRALAFGPEDDRTLADFRRSGTVEALRGGATAEQIGSKMANDFATNAFIQKTYAPVDLATVRKVDQARKRGRK